MEGSKAFRAGHIGRFPRINAPSKAPCSRRIHRHGRPSWPEIVAYVAVLGMDSWECRPREDALVAECVKLVP